MLQVKLPDLRVTERDSDCSCGRGIGFISVVDGGMDLVQDRREVRKNDVNKAPGM